MCAIAADILTLEVDNVLCVTAEYAGRLVLLEDDMIAVNVDFQSVLYFDAHSAAQLNREHDATSSSTLRTIPVDFIFNTLHFFIIKNVLPNPTHLGCWTEGENTICCPLSGRCSFVWRCYAVRSRAGWQRLRQRYHRAAEAITLAISITGLMCFWSGVMELLQASGLAERLSRLMAPCSASLVRKRIAG